MRWFVPALVLLLACGAEDQPSPGPPATSSSPTPSSSSTAAPAPSSSSTDAPPPADPPPEEHSGDATYYAPGTTGACGIKTPTDKLVAAMGASVYSKANCGQCAEVTGPNGSVIVLLNEKCGACQGDSLDLSTQAFTQIADKSAGRVKMTWHFTDCP
jgi:expansin (peptidoglycan-binding protein)